MALLKRRSLAIPSCITSRLRGQAPMFLTRVFFARAKKFRPSTFAAMVALRSSGAGWVEAAETIASKSGLPIAARVIGPGGDAEDVYGDWARLRETNEDGCLLVRPDQYVAFRVANSASNATAVLQDALSQILSHQTTLKAQPAQPLTVGAK
jgi:hypothetical protein